MTQHSPEVFGKAVSLMRLLTATERRYSLLLISGYTTNQEIADHVGTTPQVVKNALRKIFDKLGVWNRVELALYLVRTPAVEDVLNIWDKNGALEDVT